MIKAISISALQIFFFIALGILAKSSRQVMLTVIIPGRPDSGSFTHAGQRLGWKPRMCQLVISTKGLKALVKIEYSGGFSSTHMTCPVLPPNLPKR